MGRAVPRSIISLREMHELSGSEGLSLEKVRPVEKLVGVPVYAGEGDRTLSERETKTSVVAE